MGLCPPLFEALVIVISSDDGYLNLQLGNITNCLLLWLKTLKDSNHYNSILDIRKLLQSLAWRINITPCMANMARILRHMIMTLVKRKIFALDF
jgi:hypothetical protein